MQFSDIKKHLPNLLTMLRVLLVVPFVFFVLKDDFGSALIIFVLAAVSDFFDGYLARKWSVESMFGKIVDPLADKILLISSYVLFALLNHIPLYLAIVVVLKDVLIMLVVAMCKVSKIHLEFSPLMSSKINTTIQLVYIFIVLACKYFYINVPFIIELCSLFVCAFTVFSAAEYVEKYYWIKNAFCKNK